jgi:hypothetical protein
MVSEVGAKRWDRDSGTRWRGRIPPAVLRENDVRAVLQADRVEPVMTPAAEHD